MYSFGRRTNLNAQSGANPTSKNPVIALTYSTSTYSSPRTRRLRWDCSGARGAAANSNLPTRQLGPAAKHVEVLRSSKLAERVLSRARDRSTRSRHRPGQARPPPHPLFQISINYTHTVSRGPRTRTHWLKFAPDVCAWARPQNNLCFEGGRPDSRLRTPTGSYMYIPCIALAGRARRK